MIGSYGFLLNGEIYCTVAFIQAAGEFCAALLALKVFMAFYKLSIVKQERQCFGILVFKVITV